MRTRTKLTLALFLLPCIHCLISCQKEYNPLTSAITDSLVTTSTNDLWVLKRVSIHNFDQGQPFGITDFIDNRSFFYDPITKNITVRDTTLVQSAIANSDSTTYRYDKQARLAEVTGRNVKISYTSDNLPQQVDYYEGASVDHSWSFTWNKTSDGFYGVLKNPKSTSSPYSDNMSYQLTNDKVYSEQLSFGTDTSDESEKVVAIRTSGGDVSTMKVLHGKQNNFNLNDSAVYSRDAGYPPRLHDFYHFLSGGLDWLNTGSYLEVGFVEPLMEDNDLFFFDKQLMNKFTYYSRENYNLNSPLQIEYTYTFQTQYDSNKNPVFITMFLDGKKIDEISFTWQKLKW